MPRMHHGATSGSIECLEFKSVRVAVGLVAHSEIQALKRSSLVGITARTDLVDGFGVGQARQYGCGLYDARHSHPSTKKADIALIPDADRVRAIDEICFVEAKHDDSPTLWHRSNRRYCEYRNLRVDDQAQQDKARCD